MKKFSLLLILTSFSLFSQNSAKTCEILSKINTLIQRDHYRPKPVDDSLSVYVFDSFVNELDDNRNLFTKIEYNNLCKHRLLLDDYLLKNDCSFMTDFVTTYQNALKRKKKTIEKIQNDVLDYKTHDSVRFSKNHFDFDLVETDFERVWKKRARYDILEDISKMSNNLDSLSPHFSKLEKSSKAKIFENYLCKLNTALTNTEAMEKELQNNFLNLFCAYFDPHTNYFSLDTKSSFLSGLSTSGLSLGLNVTMNEKEEIVVVNIVPGGPADKTKKFEKDDIIIKISNKKGEEYFISCAPLEKISELFFSDSNKEVELTIQKKNGSIVTVFLKKQLMKATSNAVYSFVAEKETKIGYINIPNFYSDFDGLSPHGCADDVAKEIVKLKKDNIKGLVIDLQDNGGGSMDEAGKLVGMFIDYGLVSILVDNKDRHTFLKDYNHGIDYNGPIVVLINGNSASASEFFAAAMQDYKRAIIVGSNSLGKASMQSIIPLDESQQNFVKLTLDKFYRITGDSNQIKGVIPDIVLPALYDSLIQREVSFKTALKYDKISTKTRFVPFSVNFDKEIISSKIRLKTNPYFQKITTINKEINELYNENKKPIRIALIDVFKDVHEIDALYQKVKKITSTENNCTITNNSFDLEKLKSNAFQQEINSFKIKDLKNNPYLDEAVTILNDFSNFRK